MKLNVKIDDLQPVIADQFDHMEKDVTDVADRVQKGLTQELRQQVVSAGMGPRLANTWRGKRFPDHPSLGAAAFVWSKAPDIIDAFERGATIVPVNGSKYLAIPSDNVPRKSGNKRMTPEEVESSFNQDLKFFRDKKGTLIAYVEGVQASSGKGFRRPTKGRLKQGRQAQAVIMFFLVPTVRLPKRFDVDGSAEHWADEFAAGLRAMWGGS